MNFVKEKKGAKEHLLCPVCYRPMFEAEKLIENESLFVWYECPDKDCHGEWLEKKDLSAAKQGA
ncbi:MAG: hypothetical protein ACIAQZ_02390 [Sedimentisphaeraceae bacterium JB056]